MKSKIHTIKVQIDRQNSEACIWNSSVDMNTFRVPLTDPFRRFHGTPSHAKLHALVDDGLVSFPVASYLPQELKTLHNNLAAMEYFKTEC